MSKNLTGVGVNLSYKRVDMDLNLIYMIQLVTNETTEEVIGSLYENVNTIISECMKVTRARSLSKTCKIFYKKTQIPMQIEIHSQYFPKAMAALGHSVDPTKPVECEIKVGFWSNMKTIDVNQLNELAIERFESAIGISEKSISLENVPAPVVKLPKVLKGVL